MKRHLARILFLVAIAPSGLADQDQNIKRGIAPGNTYRSFDIDSINEFNGNLVIRIPLSDSVAVGPFMSHGLMLSYNSKIYDYQFIEHQNNPNDPTETLYKSRAIPESFSNAGLGWSVNPGELLPPEKHTYTTPERGWTYRSPSGSEHDFTLGPGDPAQAETHDGSFLRLKRIPASGTVEAREIEFGDGTVHRFDPDGLLTEIRDRVGYKITIDRTDTMAWVIRHQFENGTEDQTLRTITINFENRTAPGGVPYTQPNFQKVIRSIVVPVSGGTTATYGFFYVDRDDLPRDGCGDYVSFDDPEFAAPLLDHVDLPEGLRYSFTYQTSLGEACTAGIVRSATLPTRGTIEWNHQPYRLSQKECDDAHGWVVESPGIKTRVVKDEQGVITGEWTYTPAIDLSADPINDPWVACRPYGNGNLPYGPAPTEATTTVTTKERINGSLVAVGGKSAHFFSATLSPGRATATGTRTEEYGLPFTRRRAAHTSNPGRFLSSERRDESDILIRSTYVTYKGDAELFHEKLANARVQGELTAYNADTGCGSGGCYVDRDRPEADYDGYGHYRKEITTSNFAPTRTTITNYTPDSTSWILGTYTSSSVEEGGVTSKQLFTFDGNGAMKTRRILIGSAESLGTDAKKDLLYAFCRDDLGYLASERFFGGDGAGATTPADPCDTTPAATEYQIDHELTFNANGAPTKHTAAYSGMGFLIADEDLDANTGRVSTSRDVSEIATTFTYDGLGRPKEVKPTGTPWTLYEYSTPSSTTAPSVRVTTRPYLSASTASPLTEAWVYYDWMGRAIQEKSKVPSDSGLQWATTTRVYDLFSRPTSVSVPEFRSVSSFETFTPAGSTGVTYDVLGRPKTITAPDTKTTSISYTGSGVREIAKTVKVALAGGLGDATTRETYDAYGRLTDVVEANETRTHYDYDVGSRLKKVCQSTTNGTTCGQSRTFEYDNRGFLTRETHPEMSATTYTYDSRGHSLTKTIENDTSSERNLEFHYDSAERLLEIRTHHPTQSSYRSGKVFTFGADNSGSNKIKGKLETATRYNYGTGNTITVKETYDYTDTAGRLKKTTTEIKEGSVVLQTLQQSQTYGTDGNVETMSYPTCFTVSCTAAAWNTLFPAFSNGFLTGVTGFADSIVYTASGGIHKVDHTGPVTDTYTPDVTGVRPSAITFEGQSSCSTPVITSGSPADQSISPGESATLTVSATGATGYQWFEGNGTKLTGQTGLQYTTPVLSTTKTYYVEAYNDCKTVPSRVVTVSVACPSVSIPSGTPADQSIAPEQTATLSITASGATSYQWYGNGTLIPGATSSTYTTPPLTATKTYYATASNSCTTVTSRTATVTVRTLPAPTGLVATATGTSSVSISWNASTDADHYVLERKANGSGFLPVQSVYNATSFNNTGLTANTSYVYRVRAVSVSETVSSSPSSADLATTIVFSTLIPNVTAIRASQLTELLTALNAIRAANGTAATTWSAILPGGTPTPSVGGDAYAQHILSMRTAMNTARTNLGFPALSYTDPVLTGSGIRTVHQLELRGGVQ